MSDDEDDEDHARHRYYYLATDRRAMKSSDIGHKMSGRPREWAESSGDKTTESRRPMVATASRNNPGGSSSEILAPPQVPIRDLK